MQSGISSLLLAMACCQSPSANYQTNNFIVYADNAEIARQVGDAAEQHRSKLTALWLGDKVPDWAFPCRINVAVSQGQPEGMTEVSYSEGKVLFHRLDVKGPLAVILKGPLPHELAHVLFAHYFGAQPPRWADEGGAIVSEGEKQGALHHKVFSRILADGRQFPLRELLDMKHYPSDVPCLYAQGHSVSCFVVATKGHKAFLNFVRVGLDRGWDAAANEQCGYKNVEQMEKSWLRWVTSGDDKVTR